MKFLFGLCLLITNLVMYSQNTDNKDTTTFLLTARLTKAEALPAHCGIFAWAVAQKFEIAKSEIPGINSGYVIIIEPCPEFLGKDFFKPNKLYTVSVGKYNDASFDYIVVGVSEKKLPVFWSREIKLVQ